MISCKLISIIGILAIVGCESKKSNLPNDTFRETVVTKITDTINLARFDSLLAGLDKKGISYCSFVQRLSELEDSCYSVAKRKYPDPENEEDFVKTNSEATKEAHSKYLAAISISTGLSAFATSEYNSSQDIKSYCDKHK